jgi:hypothetical protein
MTGAALVLLAVFPRQAPLPAAAPDTLLEPYLVSLQLGRITSRTVPAFRAAEAALVPLYQLFDLAEIRVAPLPDGGLTAVLQPGNVRLAIRPRERELVLDGDTRTVFPQELVVRDGEVFLSTAVLTRILAVQWDINWRDLTVTIVEPNALPVARRIAREGLAAARLTPQGAVRPPELLYPLERPYTDGMVVDYSLLAPSNDALGGGAYQVGAGVDLLGGSLQALIQSEGEIRDGRTRMDASWNGVWRHSRWLTQLRLGDGLTTGSRFRALRGVAVTNAPYLRPAILGDLPYSGALGPGWQIEAYRGGRLIAFDSVNPLGTFTIDVPLQYGENPIDFVAYGPFGEVRQFNRTYRVSTDILAAGRLEYGVSAGECRVAVCQATANADVRYGVSTRWTLQAGIDQFWRRDRDNLFHPYVGATGSIGNSIGVQAELVKDAVLRGAVRYEPTIDVQVSAEVTRFARGLEQPLLTPGGRRDQITLSGFYRPFPRLGSLFLDGVVDRVREDRGTITSARLGGSVQFDVLRVLPSVRVSREHLVGTPATTRTTLVLNSILLPMRRLGPALGQVSARATLETTPGLETESGSVFLGRRVTNGLRFELGSAWQRHTRGATISALLAAELPSLRAYSTITAPSGTPATTSHYLQGSAIYDREHSAVAFAPGPSLQRAGLSGYVFIDLNDDGRRGANEPVIPEVRLQVGMGSTTTNRNGEYRIWDVTPYEATYVAVDTTSLRTPLWVPAYGAVLVEPNPNRFRVLDIPILPGGVIEGQVVREAVTGDVPVAGALVVMRHRKTGKERKILTFGDGSFYAIGVRPGEYELRLDQAASQRLGAPADPIRFTLPVELDGATISGLTLRIR